MPTLLTLFGFRFFFYSNEGKEPAHVHVTKNGNVAKIWLHDLTVAKYDGFSAKELADIIVITKEHQNAFKEAWHGYFN